MKYFFSVLFLCVFSGTNLLLAQGEGNVWYFGDHAGISFNQSPPQPLPDGALSTLEGCATISDKNGNLLFYTDGIKVYNRSHRVMPNGNNLAGHPSATQSSIIIPNPSDANTYYIFTIDKEAQENGLQYSVVDMFLNSGQGDVKTKNTAILPLASEKLTAVQHANKKDIWVICHAWQSDVFLAYLVTAKGIDKPVRSTAGTSHSGSTINSTGYLKVSPGGNRLASAITNLGGAVELFDFDNLTGKISGAMKLGKFNHPYGVEFSPNNSKLYITSYTTKQLIQFDLTQNTESAISKSQTVIYTSPNTLSALQLGPDGRIYVSRDSSNKMGVITLPDMEGSACRYKDEGFSLGSGKCFSGLPTFIQSLFTPDIRFEYDPACIGLPTKFYGLSNASTDVWKWNFGDINSGSANESKNQNPVHTFNKAGRYRVELVAGKDGIYDTVIKYIDVEPKPQPNLGKSRFICPGEEITLDAGSGLKFLWSTGDTLQKINISAEGKYWVRVTNLACENSDTVNITYLGEGDFLLGNDTTVCEGTTLILSSKLPGAKYLWVNGSRDSAIAVIRSGKYWLQTTVGDCNITDTLNVTFIPPPTIHLGNDSILCEGDEITLDAKNPGAIYLWSTGSDSQQVSVNRGGTYWVKISAGNCAVIDTVTFLACKSRVFVPNAFTPNGDGVNDYFRIYGGDIYNATLTIRNRWNEIIFETTDIYKGWDGKFKGELCPQSQFFWVLNYWEYEGNVLYPKQLKGLFYNLPQ